MLHNMVLAVMVAQTLQVEDQLWTVVGSGKSRRYFLVQMAASLSLSKYRCLPFVHTMTDCDTLSAGHGKKYA